MTVIFVLVAIGFLITLFWIFCLIFLNDFSVPSASISKFKKILVIFPHPDDEVLTAGGLISINHNTTLLLLTKGERGTSDAHLDNGLKDIRAVEAIAAAKALKVKKLVHKDFGDGELTNKKSELTVEIEKIIREEKPDLIITYDPSGLYGHPDHIVTSDIVTILVTEKFRDVKLWYANVPKKVYKLLKLPEEMAAHSNFKIKRTYPTHKVFVGIKVLNKIQAARLHRSQYQSFKKGLPLKIPPPFFHSLTLWEYFYQV